VAAGDFSLIDLGDALREKLVSHIACPATMAHIEEKEEP
jgi:hypothetical protein